MSRAATVLVLSSSWSASVDLPWSMCAMMLKLRMLATGTWGWRGVVQGEQGCALAEANAGHAARGAHLCHRAVCVHRPRRLLPGGRLALALGGLGRGCMRGQAAPAVARLRGRARADVRLWGAPARGRGHGLAASGPLHIWLAAQHCQASSRGSRGSIGGGGGQPRVRTAPGCPLLRPCLRSQLGKGLTPLVLLLQLAASSTAARWGRARVGRGATLPLVLQGVPPSWAVPVHRMLQCAHKRNGVRRSQPPLEHPALAGERLQEE